MIFVFVGRGGITTEWENTLKALNTNHVRFYDENEFWYQEDYWQDKIKKTVRDYGNPELSLGQSMGGWAALLYQPIINARKVLAFNPQTTTNVDKLQKWGGKLNHKWATGLLESKIKGKDLPRSDGKSTLYFGKTSKYQKLPHQIYKDDEGHKRLAIDLGYNVKIVNTTGHEVAYYLKKQNKLLSTIQQYLT